MLYHVSSGLCKTFWKSCRQNEFLLGRRNLVKFQWYIYVIHICNEYRCVLLSYVKDMVIWEPLVFFFERYFVYNTTICIVCYCLKYKLFYNNTNAAMTKVTCFFCFLSVIWGSNALSEKALESARCATARAGRSATFSC